MRTLGGSGIIAYLRGTASGEWCNCGFRLCFAPFPKRTPCDTTKGAHGYINLAPRLDEKHNFAGFTVICISEGLFLYT